MTRVRAYNYGKIETGQNFPPVLKIVTRTAQAAYNVNVAKHAHDQNSIFSAGRKFCSDYGLLLELHALTLSRPFLCTLVSDYTTHLREVLCFLFISSKQKDALEPYGL